MLSEEKIQRGTIRENEAGAREGRLPRGGAFVNPGTRGGSPPSQAGADVGLQLQVGDILHPALLHLFPSPMLPDPQHKVTFGRWLLDDLALKHFSIC